MKDERIIWQEKKFRSMKYEAEIEGMIIGIAFGNCWNFYCDELEIKQETSTHFTKGDETIQSALKILEKKLYKRIESYHEMCKNELPKVSIIQGYALNINCGELNIHEEIHEPFKVSKKDSEKFVKNELQRRIKKYQKILSKLKCGYVIKRLDGSLV